MAFVVLFVKFVVLLVALMMMMMLAYVTLCSFT